MALILNTIFKSDIFVATKFAKVRIDLEPLETGFKLWSNFCKRTEHELLI